MSHAYFSEHGSGPYTGPGLLGVAIGFALVVGAVSMSPEPKIDEAAACRAAHARLQKAVDGSIQFVLLTEGRIDHTEAVLRGSFLKPCS